MFYIGYRYAKKVAYIDSIIEIKQIKANEVRKFNLLMTVSPISYFMNLICNKLELKDFYSDD